MVAAAQTAAKAARVEAEWAVLDVDAIHSASFGMRFDLILAHNLLGYVRDPAGRLVAIAQLLAIDGQLSIVVGNRLAEPLRYALMRRDLRGALQTVETVVRTRLGETFGTEIGLANMDEVNIWLKRAGLRAETSLGVRCVNDYLVGADEQVERGRLRRSPAARTGSERERSVSTDCSPASRRRPHASAIVGSNGRGSIRGCNMAPLRRAVDVPRHHSSPHRGMEARMSRPRLRRCCRAPRCDLGARVCRDGGGLPRRRRMGRLLARLHNSSGWRSCRAGTRTARLLRVCALGRDSRRDHVAPRKRISPTRMKVAPSSAATR